MIEDTAHNKTDNSDLLSAANADLESYLLKNASSAALLTTPLPKSKKEMWVADSSDHKFRVFSWDTETGGTMHSYNAIAQYRAGNVVRAERLATAPFTDAGMYFSDVKTYSTRSGVTVYVITGVSIGSQVDYGGAVKAYVVKNGKLQTYKFFKTEKKLLESISFEYTASNLGEIAGFDFKDKDRTLRVPLIDNKREDTGQFLLYKFDGERFVFSGVGK